MEWRDISSAPKDGTTIILWVREHYNDHEHMLWPCEYVHGELCWQISDNCHLDYDYQILEDCTPTHWMPLPPPPTDKEPRDD